MVDRTCGWCGTDIEGMSATAQYCTRQHKKNAASKRHRERNPRYYARYVGSPARTAWAEANRDRIRSYARVQQAAYRKSHPGAAREWWAANNEKHRLYQAARRASQRAGGYRVTDRDIQRLLTRYNHRCAYCHRPGPLELDHVVPLKRGGKHSIGNLVPACRPCNASKNARLLYPWRVTVLLAEYARTLEA